MKWTDKLCLWILTLLALLVPFVRARADVSVPVPANVDSPTADHPGVVLGAHIPPVDPVLGPGRLYYWDDIHAFYDLTGRQHQIIMYYGTLTSGFDPYILDQLLERFNPPAVPYVQMDPQPTQTLNAVASGAYDVQLRAAADSAVAFGGPMLVGFAHEFNCTYKTYFGDPQAYIAAFRHVHDLFVNQGATNIQWVWPPNYASDRPDLPNSDYNLYYPGDAYVDWITVFGYNWGTTPNIGPEIWVEFDYLFDAFLTDTACRYPKPQMVHTASIDGSGGSKATWIANAYGMLQDFPSLRSIVWFNDYAYGDPSSVDFRVTITSRYGEVPAAYEPYTTVYRQAISDPFFLDAIPSYDVLKPASRVCFSINATTDTYLIPLGGSWTVRLEFENAPIFTTPVTLLLINPPAGITYSASPVQPGATYAELSLQVGSNVKPGTYNLTILAEGGGLQQFETITVTVAATLYTVHLPLVVDKK